MSKNDKQELTQNHNNDILIGYSLSYNRVLYTRLICIILWVYTQRWYIGWTKILCDDITMMFMFYNIMI